MRIKSILIWLMLWSMHSNAQDLSYCGQGYFMDLSVGYTPTGFGLELCGCGPQTSPCELVHIILRRVSGSVEESLGCTDIVLTERWWREEKDLVDIYNPLTCEEYEETAEFSDRYILPTAHLTAGDTISILVCKTDPQDPNIIELSASPGTSCALHQCAPEITCPVEVELKKNDLCAYQLPDFREEILLTDTCVAGGIDVTDDYSIIQSPAPGSTITEDLFVIIEAYNQSGEVIASCDISILLQADAPPVLADPDPIPDVHSWEPLPQFQPLLALDTSINDSVYMLDVLEDVDPFTEDACTGYAVTYRWIAEGLCGLTTERAVTFHVLPDTTPPSFASLPVDLDTIRPGESLPLLVDLVAVNPDGTTEGISMNNYILPYDENHCTGYEVTYVWTAVDTCDNYRELTKSFFVAPSSDPPQFLTDPDPIPDIYMNDPLPDPQTLTAVNVYGDTAGIEVVHSIDPYTIDTCGSFDITYRWTATDTCGASSSITESFSVFPDTLAGFVLAGIPDLMVQITLACAEEATIEIPIDLEQHVDKEITVIITDEMWQVIDQLNYDGPIDYDFGMGQFHAIYIIEDVCGNIARDTINIDALDVAPPVFICPSEQQILVTDLLTCTTEAVWALPQAFDNCDDVGVTQLSGPQPGDTIGAGNYEIVYEAIDESGNSSTCSFALVVAPVGTVSFVCLPIQVPVDVLCDATIEKEAIIGNQITSCSPGLEVTIFTENDTLTGDTFQLGGYYGQTIMYQICEPVSGICCSNSLFLIDTIPPQIVCPPDLMLTCLDSPEDYRPDFFENCTTVLWQITDLDSTEFCDDPIKRFSILKEFIAYDLAGNASAPCSILFTFNALDLELLIDTGRLSFPQDTILSCTDYSLDSVQSLVFGVPLIDSFPVEEALLCGLVAAYYDEIILDYQCSKVIKRYWSVKQEGCHHFLNEVESVQTIRIVDTTGPEMIYPDTMIHINTDEHGCFGYFDGSGIRWSDNCQDTLTTPTRLSFEQIVYSEGDLIALPPGVHELIVYQEDDCRNTSIDTIRIKVSDKVRPVSVCLQFSTIGVYDEEVFFPATSLDIGSYDNCKIQSIQVRKERPVCSDQDTSFSDYVRFCCAEVGTEVPLKLRTIDESGNANYCWGLVSVQDKIAPIITCPPDLIVSCRAAIPLDGSGDQFDLIFGTLRSNGQRQPLGVDDVDVIYSSGPLLDGTVEDNCLEDLTISISTESDINQCGLGFIYRSFSATDRFGNRSNICTQKIEIRSDVHMDSSTITWPQPIIEIFECTEMDQLSPETLGQPEFPGKACTLEGLSYEDTYFTLSDPEAEACIKIIRDWKIIDWCAPDPLDKILSFQQTIKISDRAAPVFSECAHLIIQKDQPDNCSDALVTIRKRAQDNCTSVDLLRWEVSIDEHNTGIIDERETPEKDSLGVSLNRYFPFGTHRIIWEVQDFCGNLSSCEELVTIENMSLPKVLLRDRVFKLSTSGEIMVNAEDFITEAEHLCGDSLMFSISEATGNADSSKKVLRYSCDDIGAHNIRIYVSYLLSDDQKVSISEEATLVIQKGEANCTGNSGIGEDLKGIVSGLIITEDNVALPGVTVDLTEEGSNQILRSIQSDNSGLYSLGPINEEGIYFVEPSLDGNHLAGLSTLDIVYIQRHLLGMELLETTAQYIAADVNRDKKISVSDILDIRRALLTLPSQLGQRRVWEFINAARRLEEPTNALQEGITGIFPVSYDSCYNEILAIKMGDINRSLLFEGNNKASGQSQVKAVFTEKLISKGEKGFLKIAFQKETRAYGFQLALDIDNQLLEVVDISHPVFEIEYHQPQPGMFLISASRGQAVTIKKENEFIQIQYVAKQDGALKNAIDLNSEYLKPEVYIEGFETNEIVLAYRKHQHRDELIKIYPNPIDGQFSIEVYARNDALAQLRIYDGRGLLNHNSSIIVHAGVNRITIQRPASLVSGVHYFILSIGEDRYSGKLILI